MESSHSVIFSTLVNLSRNSMFYVALASSGPLFSIGAVGRIPVTLNDMIDDVFKFL